MTESRLERVHQLIATSRTAEAEKELRNLLGTEPENTQAQALLAFCRSQQGDYKEADEMIRRVVGTEPDNDYFLYLYAFIFLQNEQPREAEKMIKSAISFNPVNAVYHGLLAQIRIYQRDWQLALDSANAGLNIDPNDLTCLNARSTALLKLNKKDESFATIREALQQDPENANTHANVGWGHLEQGDHKKALEHFAEALKLDPSHAYAKAGLVEGLKARYWFYRIFLRYAFWIGNMKKQGQWFVILGLYFGVRLLRYVAERDASLSTILTPIIVLYTIFALSTWIITPLSNLLLRINVYGRYALTEDEITSSNFVGIALVIAFIGGACMLISTELMFLMIAIFGLSMMIPFGSMLNPTNNKSRVILIGYTCLLALFGILAILDTATSGELSALATVYLIGVLAFQWIANALAIR